MADNGIDLFDASSPVRIEFNDAVDAASGPRVGVSQAADRTVAAVACRTRRRSPPIDAVLERPCSVPATESGAPTGKVPWTCAKIYDCGR